MVIVSLIAKVKRIVTLLAATRTRDSVVRMAAPHATRVAKVLTLLIHALVKYGYRGWGSGWGWGWG